MTTGIWSWITRGSWMLPEIQKNWKRCWTYSGTNFFLDQDQRQEGCSINLLHCNEVQFSMGGAFWDHHLSWFQMGRRGLIVHKVWVKTHPCWMMMATRLMTLNTWLSRLEAINPTVNVALIRIKLGQRLCAWDRWVWGVGLIMGRSHRNLVRPCSLCFTLCK